MNESKQRKYGVMFSYLSMILNILITLFYTPFLLRMMGQAEYGLYSLISSVISYLTVLDLGFGNALIVYTSKYRAKQEYEKEKKLHGMFFVIFCFISFIAFLLGILLYLNVDKIFGNTMTTIELNKAKTMMIILTINLVVTFPFSVYNSIISAYEKFVFQKLISIISLILKPIIMIPILFFGGKSVELSIVISIVNLFTLLSNYIYCRTKLNIKVKFLGFDKKVFKEIFFYSLFIFIGIVVDRVNWGLDNFILGAVAGTVVVSIYSVASQFNNLFMLLSSCCCNIMLPKLSKMVSKNAKDEELSNEFIKFGRLQWYIIFLIISGFIIYGNEFIKIWAGQEYSQSYYTALLLIIPDALVLVENIGVYIMQAKNLHKVKAINTLFGAILNLIISIPLAKKFGSIGAAMGTALTLIIVSMIINNIYYYKKVKLDVIKFWKNVLRITIPLVPIFVITFLINRYVFLANSILTIILSAIIYSLLYSSISYCLCFNNYEKGIVKNIFKKVIKR